MTSTPRTFGFYNQQRWKWTLSRQSEYMPKCCSGDSFCRPNLMCAIISKGYICIHRWRMSHTDRAFTSCGNSIIPCCLKSTWLRANLNPSGRLTRCLRIWPLFLLSFSSFPLYSSQCSTSFSLKAPQSRLPSGLWARCFSAYDTSASITPPKSCTCPFAVITYPSFRSPPQRSLSVCQPLQSSPTVYPIFLPE